MGLFIMLCKVVESEVAWGRKKKDDNIRRCVAS